MWSDCRNRCGPTVGTKPEFGLSSAYADISCARTVSVNWRVYLPDKFQFIGVVRIVILEKGRLTRLVFELSGTVRTAELLFGLSGSSCA